MTLTKRPLASAGAVVLLALSLTACGGGAPTDASVKEFCATANSTLEDTGFLKALEKKDYDKVAEIFKEQAEKAEKVGTPKGIPDDAREGFEIQVDALKDLGYEIHVYGTAAMTFPELRSTAWVLPNPKVFASQPIPGGGNSSSLCSAERLPRVLESNTRISCSPTYSMGRVLRCLPPPSKVSSTWKRRYSRKSVSF